jgi:ATP synthase subunit 6
MEFKFYSPLEQFEVYPLIPLHLGFIDFSITNQTISLFLVLFLVYGLFSILAKGNTFSFYIVPNKWQYLIETAYLLVASMLYDNVLNKKNELFFPLIFSVFFFIISINLIGLIPYSYTVTSQFIATLALSFSIFFGINIVCVRLHNLKFFCLFLPSGTSFWLAFLIVPIEIMSYIFKPLSLAIRLFCNMMAGHMLLKIIAGFTWSLMGLSGILFLMQYVPLLILIPLFALEFGIALIQAFVFSLLTCIYLNDALNLH